MLFRGSDRRCRRSKDAATTRPFRAAESDRDKPASAAITRRAVLRSKLAPELAPNTSASLFASGERNAPARHVRRQPVSTGEPQGEVTPRARHFPPQLLPAARLYFAQAAQMRAEKCGIAREPLGLKT